MANGIQLFEKYVANSLSRDRELEWWTHNTLCETLEPSFLSSSSSSNQIEISLSASIIESAPVEGDGGWSI